jgi:hypothetical protein
MEYLECSLGSELLHFFANIDCLLFIEFIFDVLCFFEAEHSLEVPIYFDKNLEGILYFIEILSLIVLL